MGGRGVVVAGWGGDGAVSYCGHLGQIIKINTGPNPAYFVND